MLRYLKWNKEIRVKNNKSMYFRIDDEKLLEKYEVVWTKIEDLKNIKLNPLPGYEQRFIKTKTRRYSDKISY